MRKSLSAGHGVKPPDALVIADDATQSIELSPVADAAPSTETTYLLRTPANARRLQVAIEQLNGGKGAERKLFASGLDIG